jgi:hypothetical protein
MARFVHHPGRYWRYEVSFPQAFQMYIRLMSDCQAWWTVNIESFLQRHRMVVKTLRLPSWVAIYDNRQWRCESN